MQYNTIQYNTIQYDTVQYNTIHYTTIQYNMIQYDTMQYNMIQYNTIQYNTIWYTMIQYNTILYYTIQYNTIMKKIDVDNYNDNIVNSYFNYYSYTLWLTKSHWVETLNPIYSNKLTFTTENRSILLLNWEKKYQNFELCIDNDDKNFSKNKKVK